jgi:hypothetical protein
MTNCGVTTPFPNLISSMRPADRTLMLKLHPHHGGTTASLPIRRPFAITWATGPPWQARAPLVEARAHARRL